MQNAATNQSHSNSLALFKLIDSCIVYDGFSDESITVDIACHAIIANDTRSEGD